MNDCLSILSRLTALENRRIHLGVTGSVSCYKGLDLLRALEKTGIHVSCTLTQAARQFVSAMLWSSLGANPVYTDMFADDADPFAHLEPGQNAQALFVVPASAATIARIARGDASDMLSAQVVAFDGPVLVAPAMNQRMWANAATQENVAVLRRRGITLVGPGNGDMACGENGTGRLAPLHELYLHALRALAPKDMEGHKVLVTLGPTREAWDGVRFWSNPSSGTMGTSLALAAWIRGADVLAVTGPGVPLELLPKEIKGLSRTDVTSAREMYDAARDVWPDCQYGLFSAAVADFSPDPYGREKFKKAGVQDGFSIHFHANPDILATLSREKSHGQKVLGFAAETAPSMEALLGLARDKCQRKQANLLAANCTNAKGSGFGTNTNQMAVVDAKGREEIWPLLSKADVAWRLLSWLLPL